MQQNLVTKKNNFNRFKMIFTKFILYYFNLTGLATIRIYSTWVYETKNWRWKFSFVPSKLIIFYNTCLICLSIAMHIMTYEDAVKSGFGGRFGKDTNVIGIFDSSIVLTAVVILGVYCIKQKNVLAIANEMRKVAISFDLIKSSEINYIIWLCLGTVLLFFSPNSLIMHPQNLFQVLYTVAFRLCMLTINSLLIQYIVMIKSIKNLFQCINENLLKLYSKFFGSNYNSLSENEFDSLMHSYLTISKLSREVSDFYSLPMLWSLLAIFVDVLMCFYHFIKQVHVYNSVLLAVNLHDLIHVSFLLILLTTLTTFVVDAVEEVCSTVQLFNFN